MNSSTIHANKYQSAREKMARGIIVSFLGMFVMACSGCGGGGSSAPAPQAKTQVPIQILAVGDSTMAGLIKNPDGTYTVTNAITTDMQQYLQAQSGRNVTVIAHGVVGSTMPDLIAGTGATPYVQFLTTDTSQLVIENMGINDEVKETRDVYQKSLEEFVTQTRAAGKIPVLEEPNPLCNPNVPPSGNVEAIDANGLTIEAYVAVVNQVGQQMGVPVVHQYSLIKALPNWCSMMSDGWGHPSVALYAIKAQNEVAVLAPIIKAL